MSERSRRPRRRRREELKLRKHAGEHSTASVNTSSYIDRTSKLGLEWQGPFQIVSKDREANNIYIVADLITGEQFRAPMNRMRPFRIDLLSGDEIKAVSAKAGEYLIQEVNQHVYDDNGLLWFHVDL